MIAYAGRVARNTYRPCTITFTERGCRHEAQVSARSTYEAVALALKQWRTQRYVKGPHRHSEVTITVGGLPYPTVRLEQVLDWLYSRESRDDETEQRKRELRALLAADDRR